MCCAGCSCGKRVDEAAVEDAEDEEKIRNKGSRCQIFHTYGEEEKREASE